MENLLEQIQKGESGSTEFKLSFQKEVIESVVAFANAKGGKIFIGVNDVGEIVGISINNESLQKYINTIKQNTQPNLVVDIEEYKTVLVVDIQEQPVKPLLIKIDTIKELKIPIIK